MSPGSRAEISLFQQEPRTLSGLGALTLGPRDSEETAASCLGPPQLRSDFLIIWIVSATRSKGMNQADLSGGLFKAEQCLSCPNTMNYSRESCPVLQSTATNGLHK